MPNLPRPVSAILMIASLAGTSVAAEADRYANEGLRKEDASRLRAASMAERSEAEARAIKLGVSRLAPMATGSKARLIRFSPSGKPVFVELLNMNAGISAGADILHQSPYSLHGTGVTVGVWDEGEARTTHVEFTDTGPTRIVNMEAVGLSDHSTAVSGTVIAGGVDPTAVGMAPRAVTENYDLLDNLSEETLRAAATGDDSSRLQLSNHSYGNTLGWAIGDFGAGAGWYWLGEFYMPDGSGFQEDYLFGFYTQDSADQDQLAYSAPYYLHVRSAGNDRDDVYGGGTGPAAGFRYWNGSAFVFTLYSASVLPNADGFAGGFDTMISEACAKNVLAVGAITDAVNAGVRDTGVAGMTTFSGWGPADDGRVKPDLVANGFQLRSPRATGDANYVSTASGTSFSAPSAAGVAALLVDQASTLLDGTRMRASTIKALMLHSATDMGRAGPDYEYGWGLVDGVKAADLLTSHTLQPGRFHLLESRLDATTVTESFDVEWDGTTELRATLCWTDPAAIPGAVAIDDRTPSLVNDLDLRISGPGGTFQPYTLDPDNPLLNAVAGDNVVDNVEQVVVAAGATAGTWTITVSHKSTLQAGEQWYSLVADGQTGSAIGAAPAMLGVSPATAINTGPVALVVSGEGLPFGSQIVLRKALEADIEGEAESVIPREIHGEVNITGVPPGFWDVVVEMPDGSELTLPGAFEVEAVAGVGGWREMRE